MRVTHERHGASTTNAAEIIRRLICRNPTVTQPCALTDDFGDGITD